jgi:alkylation response protein AidB-like acyl-CoA dehydrogenase
MNFELTEEQLSVQQAARDFAQTELLPGVIERDNKQEFPAEQIKKLGELGFLGMMVDPKYGGSGMDTVSYVLAMEELSKIDASVSVVVSVNNSLVCWGLETYGSEEQKQKYLVPMAKGEVHGAFCLSEPEAGSDATSQQTTAVDMGDYYLLNGTKNWITNGNTATYYLVIAQTNVEAGHKGINAFIVEKDWEGFVVGKKEDKLGIRGSDTHSLMFTDVKERKAFGKEIMHHQAIQFKLADMATEIEAARMLCLKAAWLKDNKMDYNRAGSMAKLFASEVAMKTTVEAVQVHGGYGFVKEYHVERLMRDAKITQIYEGTSEIQRIVISRDILK